MADKPISQLAEATQVKPADMFVLEQDSTAKKLTGQTLENWLLSFADGHGGIQSIVKKSTAGLVDTYRITLADTTIFDFTVTNGKGVQSITKQSTVGLTDTYRITYTDGTYSTFTVTNGEKGDKGDQTYVWIRWSAVANPTDEDLNTNPEAYIGIYAGTETEAPTAASAYTWYKYKGETGDAASVEDSVTEYASSSDERNPPDEGWSETVPTVPQGSYLWTRTTITFNAGDPVVVYSAARQGRDGSGTVSTVNYIEPDENGNVQLTAGSLLDLVYPVGSVYMSLNSASPASLFGGSWSQIKDVFLLGAGDTYKVTTNEKDGGASTVTLGTNQIPSHNHGSGASGYGFMRANSLGTASVSTGSSTAKYVYTNDNHHISTTSVTANAGGGQSHENMPPYKTVYMWQRIA